MPWLRMTADEAEAFDAEMLRRVAAIKGDATRYSAPEELTEKGVVAVLVASEHAPRLDQAARAVLEPVKPAVRELEPAEVEPVVKSGRRSTGIVAAVAAAMVLSAALAARPPAAAAAELSGPARVIDGDTIEIAAVRVRLYGIDAPELRQSCLQADGTPWPCGREASRALGGLLAGHAVDCHPLDLDRYGRTVATCALDGADLGSWLVAAGWALEYPAYSDGRYAASEAAAKATGAGLWRGSFAFRWLHRD